MKFELKNSFTNIAYDATIISLSNSLTFQELCSVDCAEMASKRIFIDTFEPPPLYGDTYTRGEIEKIFPCALIHTSGYGSSFGREQAGVGIYHATGRIAIAIYVPVPKEYIQKHFITPTGIRILESIAGGIVMEMEKETKQNDKQYLYFESCRISDTTVNPPEEQADIGAIAAIQIDFEY